MPNVKPNIEPGTRNVEGRRQQGPHLRPSTFSIPCSLFDILLILPPLLFTNPPSPVLPATLEFARGGNTAVSAGGPMAGGVVMRNVGLAVLAWAVVTAAAPAQNRWADKMFKAGTTHDFGNVARGAQLFHRFQVTNIYAVPLDLMSTRASCGCVTITPSARTLKPRETGTIDVLMDARRFTGPKTVSIYVTVGPEYVSTATLQVSPNSRAHVVFNPGQPNFGGVPPR